MSISWSSICRECGPLPGKDVPQTQIPIIGRQEPHTENPQAGRGELLEVRIVCLKCFSSSAALDRSGVMRCNCASVSLNAPESEAACAFSVVSFTADRSDIALLLPWCMRPISLKHPGCTPAFQWLHGLFSKQDIRQCVWVVQEPWFDPGAKLTR